MKRSFFFLFALIFAGLILVGCNPENTSDNPLQPVQKQEILSLDENSTMAKLSPETLAELAMARAATAKYHNINKALADGYADINLFVPHMGNHYLKASLVDGVFDPSKPELLVYAPDEAGGLRLVSVEFAVPVILSPNAPEGFTGDDDEWGIFLGAPGGEDDLWTLHAWVWYHNPDGIFNPTNSRVN